MLESLRNKKILLVVAHPDDELLGCGATMNKLIIEYGCHIKVVILGEGITSRSDARDLIAWEEQLKTHKLNIINAQKCIGFQEVSTYDFPDNRFDTVALLDIIKVVEKEKKEFKPTVIFTHHGGDVNVDHQRTFEAVWTACRPMQEEAVNTIVTFETPSGTEWRSPSDPKQFLPNFFVAVTAHNVLAKVQGMESYEFERRQFPHPRSQEALKIQAQRWGVSVGKEFVEAFQIIRSIC